MIIEDHMTLSVQTYIYNYLSEKAIEEIEVLREQVARKIVGSDLITSLDSGFRIEGYELNHGIFYKDIRVTNGWLWSHPSFHCLDRYGKSKTGLYCAFRLQRSNREFRMWEADYEACPKDYSLRTMVSRGPLPDPIDRIVRERDD